MQECEEGRSHEEQKPGFYVNFGGETGIFRRNPVSSLVSGTLGRSHGEQKPGFYVDFGWETGIFRRNPVSSLVSGTKGAIALGVRNRVSM